MTGREKAEAVLAALDPLDEGELLIIHDHIGNRLICAGTPVPPFTTMQAEAESWAAIASTRELKVYVAAAVARLSTADRAGLADYLGRATA